MKRVITLVVLILVGTACNEDDRIIGAGDCLEVSLVGQLCGQAIFQIEDLAFYPLGESANGHQNVFFARMTCADSELSSEETFLVELMDEYDPGSCLFCEALLEYDGNKRYNARKVDVCLGE